MGSPALSPLMTCRRCAWASSMLMLDISVLRQSISSLESEFCSFYVRPTGSWLVGAHSPIQLRLQFAGGHGFDVAVSEEGGDAAFARFALVREHGFGGVMDLAELLAFTDVFVIRVLADPVGLLFLRKSCD